MEGAIVINNLEMIDASDADKEQWNVIIETPKGSHNKYKYDDKLRIFRLAEALPEGLAFPFDFGFLPSTLGADGDPVDVLLLMDQPTFCGCLVPSRLVGIIEAEQTEKDQTKERNDRLVAIPLKTRRYKNIRSVKDCDQHMVKEIERFFMTYDEDSGKKFKVLSLHGPHRAELLAKNGMKKFNRRHRHKSR